MVDKLKKYEPEHWLDQYGDALYRYALLSLKDVDAAENMVQETLTAALVSYQKFKGNSSQLTWLVGILKHKIIDYIRKKQKELPFENEKLESLSFDKLFDHKGKWKTEPSNWMSDPADLMEKEEFWKIFEKCLDKMPDHLSHIFTMKEIQDISGQEICKVLGISETNLWVKLHRAREKLRLCLSDKLDIFNL